MIDTDETGQNKLTEILGRMNEPDLWTDWEHKFLHNVKGNAYAQLSNRAKTVVGDLHQKMNRRTG